jgi:hypothetical protein
MTRKVVVPSSADMAKKWEEKTGYQSAILHMQAGVEPFIKALATLEVPDRGPRGSDTNYDIVKKVGDAFHKKRLALLGASL